MCPYHMDTYSIIQANIKIKMSGAVDNSFQLVMVTWKSLMMTNYNVSIQN
jgi:hypothetical protein